jgi:hypothetical protein
MALDSDHPDSAGSAAIESMAFELEERDQALAKADELLAEKDLEIARLVAKDRETVQALAEKDREIAALRLLQALQSPAYRSTRG